MTHPDPDANGRATGGAAGRALVCLAVALGACAFVPVCLPTADAFETPKMFFWFVALGLAAVTGLRPREGGPAGGAGVRAASVLIAWMLLRTAASGRILDPAVLLGWILPPALYLAGRNLDRRTGRTALCVCAGVGLVQFALMFLQRVGTDPLFSETTAAMAYGPGRMVGTVGYHNQAVDLLAVCGAASLCFVRGGFVVAALAAASALSACRSGLAGVAAGSVLLAFARSRGEGGGRLRRLGPVLAVFAVAVAAATVSPAFRGRVDDALRRPFSTPALRTRATMARAAWSMIREKPLAGWGSGAYAFQYVDRVSDLPLRRKTHADLQRVVYAREPHDDFLHLWCEFGLVGLFLAGLWVAALARGLPPPGSFLLGYWAVVSCFGFPWHDSAAGPLAGLVFGILERRDGDGNPGSRRIRSALLALLAIAGAAVSFFQFGTDAGLWRALPWQGRSLAREGGLLALDGRFAEAETVLEASRKSERSPEQLNNLGFVKMRLGKAAEAEALYRAWCACGIEHRKALASLAGSLEAQGKRAEAGDVLLARHELWPRESRDEDLFRTAVLLLGGNETAKASHLVGAFRRRNGATARWTAEWENLSGAVALRLGDTATARDRFRRALEMKPDLESARRNLQSLR